MCGHTSENFQLLKMIMDWYRLSKQMKESLVLEVFKQLPVEYLLQRCKESIIVYHENVDHVTFIALSRNVLWDLHEIMLFSIKSKGSLQIFSLQNSVLNLVWQPVTIVMFLS